MRNESRALLPGELKNCYFHCGSCKKRNLFHDFEKTYICKQSERQKKCKI